MSAPASALELDCCVERPAFSLRLETRLALEGITVLFGPNGSGKTSALRVIGGLGDGVSGRIMFCGETWLDSDRRVDVPAHRRKAAMVFQENRLFGHLSVAGNIAFAVKRARADGPVITFDEVVETFDLAGLAQRACANLSGGERQRVAIARALASRPRLLLMDEPLSALDIVRRADAMGYIEQIPDRFGVPVIYVTHAIDEAARLATQIALMAEGEIVTVGPVQDTLARLDLPPLTGRFEAGVVLAGKVAGFDAAYDLTSIDIGAGQLVVPRLDLPTGHDVRLRVRARDVALANAAPLGTSIRNVLKARVEEIAAEPDTAYAEVRLQAGNQALRARITRLSVDELALAPGKPVYALIKSVALDRRLIGRPAK